MSFIKNYYECYACESPLTESYIHKCSYPVAQDDSDKGIGLKHLIYPCENCLKEAKSIEEKQPLKFEWGRFYKDKDGDKVLLSEIDNTAVPFRFSYRNGRGVYWTDRTGRYNDGETCWGIVDYWTDEDEKNLTINQQEDSQ